MDVYISNATGAILLRDLKTPYMIKIPHRGYVMFQQCLKSYV